MRIRRMSTVAVGTIAAFALGMGPASAHFCFFNDPNPNADKGRAGSNGFFPFSAITDEFGLCEDGAQMLADAGGVQMNTLINAHGTMAGPTNGNKAIGHMDFDGIMGVWVDAFAACGMEAPPF